MGDRARPEPKRHGHANGWPESRESGSYQEEEVSRQRDGELGKDTSVLHYSQDISSASA